MDLLSTIQFFWILAKFTGSGFYGCQGKMVRGTTSEIRLAHELPDQFKNYRTISYMRSRRPLADKILIPLPPPNLKSPDNGRQWKYPPDHTFFQHSLGKEDIASCWKSECNPTNLLPRVVSYQPPNYLSLKVSYHGSGGWGVILIQGDIGIQCFAIWNNHLFSWTSKFWLTNLLPER